MPKNLPKLILGIETSCDDTSLAVYNTQQNKVLAQLTLSQIAKHAKFGGVVPEIAGREHLTALPVLFNRLLKLIAIKKDRIDCIAVTINPGLIGSLLTGLSYAKALAFALGKPLIGVDHLKAHIFSVFIEQHPPRFPFLSLLASGGHTQICLVKGFESITTLGKTVDDACGEAFDKAAQMIGLTYPGGAHIEKLAAYYHHPSRPNRYVLPLPFKNYPATYLNFSYSGLKTALRNLLISQKLYFPYRPLQNYAQFTTNSSKNTIEKLSQIASAFQTAAIDQLIDRLSRAALQTGVKTVAICGGVSANRVFNQKLADISHQLKLYFLSPHPQYTQDNGAMIAFLAYLKIAHQFKKTAFLRPGIQDKRYQNFLAKNFKSQALIN